MPFTSQLGGLYPRSEQLIELTRSYERGKTDLASVERQLELDTLDLVKLEQNASFENITDGAFSWQDQLRPLVDSLEGVTTGTRYSRWFDTNTFFKKPTVSGKISLAKFDLKKFIRTDFLPKSKAWKVSLVGPFTFSELAENLHYRTKSDFITDVALAQHETIRKLKASGVSQFQISEPCLVYRPYREAAISKEEVHAASAGIRKAVQGIDASFTVQTYFGDARSIIPDLLELPVNGIGFDLFETDYSGLKIETQKKVALGIVDSRESNVEDPRWISETAVRASKHIISDIVLVPNSDLKFVPRKVADAKTAALAKATRLLEGN